MTIIRKSYLALAAVSTLAIAPVATAQQAAKVTVTVNNVANASGTIRGSLCPDADVFAKTTCPNAVNASAPAAAGAVVLNFADVKPGTYGLAVFHDEDGDGQINVFSDAFAFGNNAKDLPPIFETSALKVTGDLKTETTLFRMVQ
jgi:uncharacterized protein (DUF2141 family)